MHPATFPFRITPPNPHPKSDLFSVLCHWANIDFLSLSVASGTEADGLAIVSFLPEDKAA